MLNIFFKILITFCDAPENWQINIQDPASPALEGMIYFHNYIYIFLIIIGTLVFWMLYVVTIRFNKDVNKAPKKFTHSSLLEIIWTIVPAIFLVFIAIPSFSLLYSLDEIVDPTITLKIIGHQWYWSYEYSDFATISNGESLSFDSYMINSTDLTLGTLRLLEVDNRVMLPINTHIRLLISSADVIHSWAVPSFGIKIDATPGRLSQTSIFIKREGVFYGQCSEICGVNHGFMPIVVKGLSISEFTKWISFKIDNLI
jgi:cytochrome c oxidase subunit 2